MHSQKLLGRLLNPHLKYRAWQIVYTPHTTVFFWVRQKFLNHTHMCTPFSSLTIAVCIWYLFQLREIFHDKKKSLRLPASNKTCQFSIRGGCNNLQWSKIELFVSIFDVGRGPEFTSVNTTNHSRPFNLQARKVQRVYR